MAKVGAMTTGDKGAVGAMTTDANPALVPTKPPGGKPAPAKIPAKAPAKKGKSASGKK